MSNFGTQTEFVSFSVEKLLVQSIVFAIGSIFNWIDNLWNLWPLLSFHKLGLFSRFPRVLHPQLQSKLFPRKKGDWWRGHLQSYNWSILSTLSSFHHLSRSTRRRKSRFWPFDATVQCIMDKYSNSKHNIDVIWVASTINITENKKKSKKLLANEKKKERNTALLWFCCFCIAIFVILSGHFWQFLAAKPRQNSCSQHRRERNIPQDD